MTDKIEAYQGSHDAGEERLDTGMKVSQAVDEAMLWWENKARKMIHDMHLDRGAGVGRSFNPNPTDEVEAQNSLPSAILKGEPWENLTREEKMRVVKIWHHFNVRLPRQQDALILTPGSNVPPDGEVH